MADPALVFLQDMAVVTLVAAAVTLAFRRLKQPAVLGYILAGVIVGPFTPPFAFVQDQGTIAVLGQLGIVVLLFSVGLEFNVRKLKSVGASALVAAVMGTTLLVSVGYAVGRAFDLAPLSAAFLGAIMSVSSTTIIVRVLQERQEQDTPWARFALGITLVEDVLAVVVLTLLSTAAAAGGIEPVGAVTVLGRLLLFLASAFVLGVVIVPRLVTRVAATRSDELLVLTVVGLAFGMAILASVLGFSTALGAFVMGTLVAESQAARTVAGKVAPLRDLFTAVFFVTVGMLVAPALLVANLPLILTVTAAILAGRLLLTGFATFVTGHGPAFSVRVGATLIPLGEFSFVIAGLAVTLGLTDAPLYAVAVGASALTAFTAPPLLGSTDALTRALARATPPPVRAYARTYHAWLERIREARDADTRVKPVTQAALRAHLYAAAALAILFVGARSVELLSGLFAATRVPDALVLFVAWGAVAAVALPFVLLFSRNLTGVAEALANAVPVVADARGIGDPRALRLVLRYTFLLAGALVFGTVAIIVVSPLLPRGPPLVAVAGGVASAVAVIALLLYRALVRFHARVDETVARILEDEEPELSPAERADAAAFLREKYAWDVTFRDVVVPADSPLAGLPIRDSRLRARTGATVMSVSHGNAHVFNPDPSTVLHPGDRVVIAGAAEQVAAAERAVSGEAMAAAPVHEVHIEAGSELEGRTLREAEVRARTGATVLGIQRDTERLPATGTDERIVAGDRLLVTGTTTEISRLEALARGAAEPAPAESAA